MKAVKNFAQFFSLFNKMENADEELKCELVGTFTAGRTTSLRDMTGVEYNKMCESMQAAQYGQTDADFKAEMRALRSSVLNRLQKMGIDTSDWAQVDNYCLNPRIAGKIFKHLSKEELKALIPKLSAISRKKKKATTDRVEALVDFNAYVWN